MKLVGCYITCFIFQDVPTSANIKINDESYEFLGQDLKSKQAYVRVSLQKLETIFSKKESLNIQISAKDDKVARLLFSYEDYISCHKHLPETHLPEIVRSFVLGLTNEVENTQKAGELASDGDAEQKNFRYDAALLDLRAHLAKADTNDKLTYSQLISNRSDLSKIILEHPKDMTFFNEAAGLFGLDGSVLKSRLNAHLKYWSNPKVPYYALRIIQRSNTSITQKHQAVDVFWQFLLKLVSEHDDFWDTTYFQKTLCLIYSMLKFDIERKNLLASIQRNGAELFINPQDIASILEDTDLLAENFIRAFTCTNDAPASFETLVSLSILSKSSFRNRRRFNRLLLASSDSLKDGEIGALLQDPDTLLRWSSAYPIFDNKKHPLALSEQSTSKNRRQIHQFLWRYSCNKYLNDRVEACFNAWFEAMPYPKAIFVGRRAKRI